MEENGKTAVEEDVMVDDSEDVENEKSMYRPSKKRKNSMSEESGSSKKRKNGKAIELESAFENEVTMFYDNLMYTVVCSVNGVEFEMDKAQLGEILGVPTDGLKEIEGKASDDFKNLIIKRQGVERRCIASIVDLVLLEALAIFCSISFPALIIEHTIKVVNAREGKHNISYGFFLTKVFEHFNVLTGKATVGTRKQIFTMNTLEESKNALLRAQLVEKAREPGPNGELATTNDELRDENDRLKQNIDELRDQMV
ncbi:hypothetical protein RND71_005927 [Anisodus tanguticus]|uniref:Uncharacterized protein n=1 Tax=Anisodus tanguticus TaxID=243964 RepID=A0AAE1VVU4_9SOLA|nr:hypothetical protein RND71_005927 [Anisodus tanguticus]